MTGAAFEISRPRTEGRVWLVDLTHTQQLITSDVMPNAIGCVATFAEAQIAFETPIRLFKYPEKLAQALDAETPDVIGFSNYVWNSRLAYRFAEVIRLFSPRTVIVFGGPNYPVIPQEQEAFLQKRPVVDFYIVKEGEVGFASLAEALIAADFNATRVKQGPAIDGVHWLRPDGTPSLPASAPRLTDLTTIPSPYATGKLDEFFDGSLIPILQTNRGCPFACTFCVEGVGYYNKVYRSAGDKIAAEIDYIGRKMSDPALRAKGGRRDTYISDSNFGMYKDDLETCRELARSMELYGWPEYINTTTGKNQKARVLEAARMLKGALRLSGSVQSLDPTVLKLVKRDNISEAQILELAMKAAEVKANSYSEIIMGLPGDTRRAHFQSIHTIVDAGFNNVYTWQLMLLPGSELCTEESRREFGMVTKYRVLPRCYGHFEVRGVPVVASEIEEVCIAHNTLSFEDYLACRRLHLVISIFYNDTVLQALIKLLKMLGVSPFEWLKLMAEMPVEGRLKEVFDSFDRETHEELWDGFEALAEFADRKETVIRYINGEIGNNVLYIHRTMAQMRYAPELAAFARTSIRALLESRGQLAPDVSDFIDDVLVYALARMSNIFADREKPVLATLRYDLPAFERDTEPAALSAYAHDTPRQFRFELSAEQEDIITRYTGIYGTNLVGISRILMKLYVGKLFRRAVADDSAAAATVDGRGYVISGLQDSLA